MEESNKKKKGGCECNCDRNDEQCSCDLQNCERGEIRHQEKYQQNDKNRWQERNQKNDSGENK